MSIQRRKEKRKTEYSKKKKQNRIAEAAQFKLPDGVKLIHGDFIEKGKEIVKSNPIGLIFVDPPYADEYLYLYNQLGELARELADGVCMAVYCTQHRHDERISRILQGGAGLVTKRWILPVNYTQGHDMDYQEQISIHWKPLVVFVKGDKLREGLPCMPDVIYSPKPDKSLDEWAQNTAEAEHLIKYRTFENEIVFDPMMGREATTGKACLNLKRQFIGFEIDDNNYRLAEATLKDHSQKIREEEKEVK
jgi:hypothetical protein